MITQKINISLSDFAYEPILLNVISDFIDQYQWCIFFWMMCNLILFINLFSINKKSGGGFRGGGGENSLSKPLILSIIFMFNTLYAFGAYMVFHEPEKAEVQKEENILEEEPLGTIDDFDSSEDYKSIHEQDEERKVDEFESKNREDSARVLEASLGGSSEINSFFEDKPNLEEDILIIDSGEEVEEVFEPEKLYGYGIQVASFDDDLDALKYVLRFRAIEPHNTIILAWDETNMIHPYKVIIGNYERRRDAIKLLKSEYSEEGRLKDLSEMRILHIEED